jgi:hypothetical protein
MSLGFYCWFFGFVLLLGSYIWIIGGLIFEIPIHIFCLQFFEEFELELRLGQPCLEHKK